MMDFITVPLVVGIITLGIYRLFELFVRRKERLILIEKLNIAPNPDVLNGLPEFPAKSTPSFGTLKAACLLIGVALGLLTGFLIVYFAVPNFMIDSSGGVYETKSIVYGACVLLFGGLGLIAAFLVEQKIVKK